MTDLLWVVLSRSNVSLFEEEILNVAYLLPSCRGEAHHPELVELVQSGQPEAGLMTVAFSPHLPPCHCSLHHCVCAPSGRSTCPRGCWNRLLFALPSSEQQLKAGAERDQKKKLTNILPDWGCLQLHRAPLRAAWDYSRIICTSLRLSMVQRFESTQLKIHRCRIVRTRNWELRRGKDNYSWVHLGDIPDSECTLTVYRPRSKGLFFTKCKCPFTCPVLAADVGRGRFRNIFDDVTALHLKKWY